ncbi:hypothetical protein KKI17_00190 [Patescibacteria group bacterium]|nr:hypothetical protein [Patescibacteria group bacterium]
MTILVLFLLFLASAAALGYLVGKRLPELCALPEENGKSLQEMRVRTGELVSNSKAVHYLRSPDLSLQKLLSFLRIVSLRAEHKTSQWLEQQRKRSQRRKESASFSDRYWEKLKGKRGGKA